MSDTPTTYPLCWPIGRPRTKSRKFGRFCTTRRDAAWTNRNAMTVAEAVSRVQAELDRIGAKDALLSTNLRTRLDGLPRSDQAQPQDPGVALYFKLSGKPHCLPCDTYTKVEHNIAALAAHIEATRAITRHGVADLAAMFTGFSALPSPEAVAGRHWTKVLEVADDASKEQVLEAYRRLAMKHHPDRPGGDTTKFHIVEAAFRMAEQEGRA